MDTPAIDTPQTALLALVLAGGPARPRQRLLLQAGDPLAAHAGGTADWQRAGLAPEQIRALRHPDPAALAAALAWLAQPGHHLLGLQSEDYPSLLRRAPNPPLALFVDGDPTLLWHPAIAVVGSRSASAGGSGHAREFSRALARAGFAITSGLAAGIDAVAHAAALDANATTIAVVGTGPDLAYPAQHAALRDRIAACGAVVSEHPPGTAARAAHFPARNRIIAGLSLGTLVVEAAQRSGALITARLAAEAGREVFAIPGSIHNPMARGCHRLIRDGASLAQEPDDVIRGVAQLAGQLASDLHRRLAAPIEVAVDASPPPSPPPDPDYQKLWEALGHDPTPMDSLIQRTGLTAAELSSMLLVMELEGRVVVEHGRYTRHS